MAWVPLPITGPPHLNLSDEKELDVRSAQVIDAYVDEAGFTVKRPGLSAFVDTMSGFLIDGLYWWDEAEKLLVVTGTNLYAVSDSSGTLTLIATGLNLPIGNMVSFATTNDGLHVLMAGGQNIISTDGVTAASLADPDAPTTVRSLAVYDQYTIAQIEGSGTFAFDEVGSGATAWRAQDIATAEAKPDRVLALLGTLDGFVLFGRTSTEFWVNDGTSPFTRVQGLTFDRGCGARYSPAKLSENWFWIDNRRFVIHGTLNKLEEISGPIDRELQALSTIEDAIGSVLTVHGWSLYILTFPTANRTFVYDVKQNAWSEWGQWSTLTGSYDRFRGNVTAYSPKWNLHLVGDREVGLVYKMDKAFTSDAGAVLRSSRRTGFLTHGTNVRKQCKAIRLRLKRSVATSGVPNPVMQVRWRQDGGAWGVSRSVSLGAVGENELLVRLNQCGTYRTRQYEFSHSDATDWILMSGEEDVEVRER